MKVKLSDAARYAAAMVFDDEGRLDPAWVVKGWPFSEMSPSDRAKINAGIAELEAFGLVSHKPAPVGSILKEDIRLTDLSVRGRWPDVLDSTIPVQ